MMRVVFDTNILVSAMLSPQGNENSIPAQALNAAEWHGQVLYSDASLAELLRVLERPKFARYVDAADIEQLFAHIRRTWHVVPILQSVVQCRDPKDDLFLDIALNGSATHLVSGDDDLLVLHPFRSTVICTARMFLDAVSTA